MLCVLSPSQGRRSDLNVFAFRRMVGIMLSQVSYYVSKYQRDPRWMKWIVYTVWWVDLLPYRNP